MKELLKALELIELRLCQTRLANSIGKKSKAKQISFLLNCIGWIEQDARAAIAKATGKEVA
jgi:hypothetical protein